MWDLRDRDLWQDGVIFNIIKGYGALENFMMDRKHWNEISKHELEKSWKSPHYQWAYPQQSALPNPIIDYDTVIGGVWCYLMFLRILLVNWDLDSWRASSKLFVRLIRLGMSHSNSWLSFWSPLVVCSFISTLGVTWPCKLRLANCK